MKLTGEELINLLYKCVDNQEIIELRKKLGVYDTPIITKDFKEDGYDSIESDKMHAEIFFSDISKFDKNVDNDIDCSILFSGIDLWKRTKIPLPFGLKMRDSLEVAIQKIGKEPDIDSDWLPYKGWRLKRSDGAPYTIGAMFKNDDFKDLHKISLHTVKN